jgi:hypothetical protein
MLMTMGRAVLNKTKQNTPMASPHRWQDVLRKSWRLKKVKTYQAGKVAVVRVESTSPRAHLIELGHQVVTGGSTRQRLRSGAMKTQNQLKSAGVKFHGRTEPVQMLAKAIDEAGSKFYKSAEKMLDKLTSEVEM